MAAVLVVFESKYGQSSKIAEHIGEAARARGHTVRVLHIDNLRGVDMPQYDAITLVSPVYFSRHPRNVRAFVRAHIQELSACRRSAFFSVSNSAASKDPGARSQARSLAETFTSALGWRPHVIAIAGGAVAYPRYGFLTRFIMLRIARSNGEATDTRHTHELTDWKRVEDDVAALLGPIEVADAREQATL